MQVETTDQILALEGLAQSPDAIARSEAIQELTSIDHDEARDVLLASLLAERHYRLVEAIVGHLSASGDLATGGKALRLADRHPDSAAVFAYRRVASAIGARLGQPASALVECARGDLPPRLLLARPPIPQQNTPSVVPEPSTVPVAAIPPRLERPSTSLSVAFVSFGVLVSVFVLPVWRGTVGPDAGRPEVSPRTLVESRTPWAFTNARVAWQGVVESIDPSGCAFIMNCGTARVSVSFKNAASAVVAGETVGVNGRIVGRSRFGTICLDGDVVRP